MNMGTWAVQLCSGNLSWVSGVNNCSQKNGEADVGRVMTSVNSSDNVCRRCATELDVHIGQYRCCHCRLSVIYFATAAVAIDSSHMTASSLTSWSIFSPPSNFFDGHVSTMWFMVCCWPQSQEGDWARPHLCMLARHGPSIPVQKRHYVGKFASAGTPVNNWGILLERSFTPCMQLLMTTSAFGLERRH